MESKELTKWTKQDMLHQVKLMREYKVYSAIIVLCEMVEQLLDEGKAKDEAYNRLCGIESNGESKYKQFPDMKGL